MTCMGVAGRQTRWDGVWPLSHWGMECDLCPTGQMSALLVSHPFLSISRWVGPSSFEKVQSHRISSPFTNRLVDWLEFLFIDIMSSPKPRKFWRRQQCVILFLKSWSTWSTHNWFYVSINKSMFTKRTVFRNNRLEKHYFRWSLNIAPGQQQGKELWNKPGGA